MKIHVDSALIRNDLVSSAGHDTDVRDCFQRGGFVSEVAVTLINGKAKDELDVWSGKK